MTIQDTTKLATGDKTASVGQTAPADVVKKHEYEFHPIANIFPMMEGKEFEHFKADIRTRKLQEPITVYENKVLDGRNRYKACKDLGG